MRRTRQPSMFFRDETDNNQSESHSGHQQLRFTRNYMGAWRTWRRPPMSSLLLDWSCRRTRRRRRRVYIHLISMLSSGNIVLYCWIYSEWCGEALERRTRIRHVRGRLWSSLSLRTSHYPRWFIGCPTPLQTSLCRVSIYLVFSRSNLPLS